MITVAYVTSLKSDNFAWYAYNDEEDHLLDRAINLHFDGPVDVVKMSVEEAIEEYQQTAVPTSVPYGTVDRFYYGS